MSLCVYTTPTYSIPVQNVRTVHVAVRLHVISTYGGHYPSGADGEYEPDVDFKPIVSLPEVEVKTGECSSCDVRTCTTMLTYAR